MEFSISSHWRLNQLRAIEEIVRLRASGPFSDVGIHVFDVLGFRSAAEPRGCSWIIQTHRSAFLGADEKAEFFITCAFLLVFLVLSGRAGGSSGQKEKKVCVSKVRTRQWTSPWVCGGEMPFLLATCALVFAGRIRNRIFPSDESICQFGGGCTRLQSPGKLGM